MRAHAERLPADHTIVVHHKNGHLIPYVGQRPILSQSTLVRGIRTAWRVGRRHHWTWERTRGYLSVFGGRKIDVVLAEFGPFGVAVMNACNAKRIPLIVHFHGYDASLTSVLHEYAEQYQQMFAQAAAIIAVSRAMETVLVRLGCPAEKIVYLPYGVDCREFTGATPRTADLIYVAAGRMVEKKAPHLSLLAFSELLRLYPHARLHMIGDGPLRPICIELAAGLGISHAVTFLGSQVHSVVKRELRLARAFIQHSVTASTGDAEGTPVAILEASAAGLPIISTRHAGIPDVVVNGETGLLCDERDVGTMARNMASVAQDPDLADNLGRRGAERIRRYYSLEQNIDRLSRVLRGAILGTPMLRVRQEIEAEYPPTSERAEINS